MARTTRRDAPAPYNHPLLSSRREDPRRLACIYLEETRGGLIHGTRFSIRDNVSSRYLTKPRSRVIFRPASSKSTSIPLTMSSYASSSTVSLAFLFSIAISWIAIASVQVKRFVFINAYLLPRSKPTGSPLSIHRDVRTAGSPLIDPGVSCS